MASDKLPPRLAKNNPILANIKKQFSGEVHRPGHVNFMNSSEIAKAKVSGIRDNELGQQFELWLEGELVITVTYDEALADKDLFSKRQIEYFGIIT